MLFDRESRHKIYIETMERELKRLEDGDLAGIRFVYSAEWQILPSRFWGRSSGDLEDAFDGICDTPMAYISLKKSS